MQRTAQKRSILNKLREMTDVGRIATEKYFNPEFKELIDQLRGIDDGARAIAAGEQVGEASAPSDATSLKDLLKSAKSNINRREYMKAISDLGRFHKKVFDMVQLLGVFKSNIEKIHERFLFQDIDDDTKKHLSSFKDRWKGASAKPGYFIKEANILDFFTNIATERGRALSTWEKRYPHRVKQMKTDVASLLTASEKLLSVILGTLKDLAKARATRNPDNYITISNKIGGAFKIYDDGDHGFKKFYETHVKGFLEKQEFFAPTKIDDTSKPKELGQKDIGTPLAPTIPPLSGPGLDFDQTQTLVKYPGQPTPGSPPVPPLGKIPTLPPVPRIHPRVQLDPEAPKSMADRVKLVNPMNQIDTGATSVDLTMPTIQLDNPVIEDINPETGEITHKTSHLLNNFKIAAHHKQFFASLSSLNEESPILIGAHISKYARSIMGTDPETAIKLLQIAKSVKG
jgi:hypothetical protein